MSTHDKKPDCCEPDCGWAYFCGDAPGGYELHCTHCHKDNYFESQKDWICPNCSEKLIRRELVGKIQKNANS